MTVEPKPRSKRILFGTLALLLVAAAATLPLLPRDNSIDNMLPRDSNLLQMLGFLQKARFAGQVAISFERSDDLTDPEFIDAVGRVVKQLDSPLIEQITFRMNLKSSTGDILFFQQQIPALTDAGDLRKIEKQLTPDGIDRMLREAYMSLVRPGGSVALPLLQRDPFGIEQEFLSGLQALAASSGYDIKLKHGHLFSRDGQHLLAVLETSAPVTDVSASKELLADIDSALAGLPPDISADVVCGHRHSVSNEQILKRDVQRAVLAASLGFILLFALCFRDVRAQFIFAIPLASVLLSIHLCRWITGPLSLLVLGFGVVIVGIAVDYGIHMYVALRKTDDRPRAWRLVVRPVVLGALTTLGVFIAFFTAGVPGYTQMAVFSIISIILSLLGALFVLPPLIKTDPPRRSGTPSGEGASGRGGLFLLWALLLVVLLIPFPRLSFDGDLKALDGSGRDVLQAEERFRHIWGDGPEAQGMVVLEAEEYQSALERNDALYETIRSQGSAGAFSSFSRVWKSKQNRAANAARWQDFWSSRFQPLEKQFAEQGAQYGFKPDAFQPFFQLVAPKPGAGGTLETVPAVADEPEDNRIFENLKTRFTQSLNGKYQIISFFPDTREWVGRVREALGEQDALLISRRELNRALSEGTVAIVRRVAVSAVALVILFTLLLMRRPKEVLPALLPSAVSVIAVLKIMEVFGLPVNIPTLIAGIVVIGLSIDYGIFMVFGCRRGTLHEVWLAITLSTLTSLIGAGVLLLTRHPALFSIGVTMTAGLLAGYATAMCAVPYFFSRDWKKRKKAFPSIGKPVCILLIFVFGGCMALQPKIPVEPDEIPQPEKPFPPRLRAVQSVVFSFYGRTMTGIGVLELDRETRSFELSCMTPMGSKLFDLCYADETPEVLFALPFFTEKKGFAEAVAADIARMYFDLEPAAITRAWKQGADLAVESRDGNQTVEYRYAGDPPILTGKRFRQGRALQARVEYIRIFQQDGFRCIGEAVLESRSYGYELTVRTKELTVLK